MAGPPSAPPIGISVQTRSHAEMVSITASVAACVPPSFNGICHVFCTHTTAGLTINENADPDVAHDLLSELNRLVPWRNPAFRHAEGNSAAHVKASLMGAALAVPVADGHLALGVWQGLYLCEFDGPRTRTVLVQFAPAAGQQPLGSARMIIGIGTDILETERMRSAIQRHGERFLAHVFTPEEVAGAPAGAARDAYFAARWAAKEAVAKALGTGIGTDCAWTDVTVRRGPSGEPLVELSGCALATARRRGIGCIHLSISHERNLATATAVAERQDPASCLCNSN